jgi:hypothetical protein
LRYCCRGAEENNERSQSGEPVLCSRFEPGTKNMRKGNHSPLSEFISLCVIVFYFVNYVTGFEELRAGVAH